MACAWVLYFENVCKPSKLSEFYIDLYNADFLEVLDNKTRIIELCI